MSALLIRRHGHKDIKAIKAHNNMETCNKRAPSFLFHIKFAENWVVTDISFIDILVDSNIDFNDICFETYLNLKDVSLD